MHCGEMPKCWNPRRARFELSNPRVRTVRGPRSDYLSIPDVSARRALRSAAPSRVFSTQVADDRTEPAHFPRVSVATCLLNEEEVLPELIRRVTSVLDTLPGGPHELVLVDDGSTDRTFALISAASLEEPRIVGVELSRNFGHQAALSAALEHATGDVVILMDGDLQDPPEEIPRFLKAHADGYDVVYAQRIERKESRLLRSCYHLFYRTISRLSDLKLPLDSGDFSLLSRRVVNELLNMPEHNRYIRGMRTWVGFRQLGLPVSRAERAAGAPAYNTRKLFRLAFDGIFAFSTAPLRAASIVGLAVTTLSFLYAAYAIVIRIASGESPKGFTALIVAMTFFAGVQLLFLGVIGEYLGRIYDETKRRPQFVVSQIVGGTPIKTRDKTRSIT
jgi:dolichol-phosphate mannosyltransferase